MIDGGKPRACPIYIVADVSQSMWKSKQPGEQMPFDILNQCLSQLLFHLDSEIEIREAAFISVISFSSEVQVVFPLTQLAEAEDLQTPDRGSQTDFARLFADLRAQIALDCEPLRTEYSVRKPTVFLITDGEPFVGQAPQPESEWTPHRDALVAADNPLRPHILSFGFGTARESTLCRTATELGGQRLAYIAEQSIAVGEVLDGITDALFHSIGKSVLSDALVPQTPKGMRPARCGVRVPDGV
ncbi:VWA domain-containing protein [Micromonospora sp. AP08]|uniref:vWA domain-containing protein n=1 Tax=Micromonospora sp. AP08 TaxID=2604467 RepID=UPI0011DB5F9C|nr:VWA domain-containing protein [Micromonospora sp. AP08]TYB38202.1 VWA domain-containing protein [Micromonospora sp. AP08]